MKVFQAIEAAEAAMLQKEGALDENQQLSQTVSNLKLKLSEAEVALAKADKITLLPTARNPMKPMPGPSPMPRTTQRKETDQWNW